MTRDNYYSQTNGQNRWPIHCKVDFLLHSRIEEIATLEGTSIPTAASMLLDNGVEYYEMMHKESHPSVEMAIYSQLKKQHKKNQLFLALAEIQQTLSEEEFLELCAKNGFSVDEVDEFGTNDIPPNKRARVRRFLETLFFERTDGIPAKRVMDFAKQQGFGEKMVYEEAEKMRIQMKKIGNSFTWMKQQ